MTGKDRLYQWGMIVLFLAFSSWSWGQPSTDTGYDYRSATLVQPDTVVDTLLYERVDRWLGTPYRYGGTDTTGTDCSNLAGQLYRSCYDTTLARSSDDIFQQCKPIPQSELNTGDLVFFKIDGNDISHVGVYLDNGKFVHASTQAGVTISDLSLDYYQKHFFKGGRILKE